MSTEQAEPQRYLHAEIEARWQRFWDEHETFRARRTDLSRPKRFALDMFPYPSGAGLHVGHPEGYTATDILARHWRMKGYDVLHPMGWDAFGLPAEQYAIETGTHPAETTKRNIETFKRQLKSLGFSYDWSREIDTTDPAYVRWTQWIFLQLYKNGLVYQDRVNVNWCAALGTVLANEEIVDGKSERGGHPVVRTPLRQWMMRITRYADRLQGDLDALDWPHGTLAMQRDWIGRSEGARIVFGIEGRADTFEVFTTRPDTLMGCTYCVLAPEHALALELTTAENKEAVAAYVKAAASKSDRDRTADVKKKTGVPTGAFAIHPISGAKVPIWVADYVIGGYGTGAVMAVPGHDDRDFAFAKAFDLAIVEVVSPAPELAAADRRSASSAPNPEGSSRAPLEAAFTGDGIAVNSGEFDGLTTAACKKAMIDKLASLDKGGARITYKLRDWVFSRQRYWGEPIPVYFPVTVEEPGGDPRKGAKHTIHHDQPIAVEESELPLRLPDLSDFKPGDDPAGPLARAVDWRFFQKDGKWYARETNTMPQWAGSCWYYLRFTDPHNREVGWSEEAYRTWMPVDLYVGGAEHAVLHLLYARFWHKALFDLGFVKDKEPFTKLVHQGMILGEDGEKMSKSRGNVVNPDHIVKMFGADALRMYEMFMGPLEAVKPWQTSQVSGVVRFRDRLYSAVTRSVPGVAMGEETKKLLHRTIKKVGQDIEAMAFNTAISAMMVFTNHLYTLSEIPRDAVVPMILLVSPFAPHLGEELWSLTGHTESLAYEPWPAYDEALCVDDVVEVAIQVNGKVRGKVTLAKAATESDARTAALAVPGVAMFTDGKQIKKFVYVPGKIVNLVVA